VATEEGELVFCDWGSSKKADDDEAAGPRKAVKQFVKGHYATPVSLQRSPHFADMFLTVGDWSFHIWKAGGDVRIRAWLFFDSCLSDHRSHRPCFDILCLQSILPGVHVYFAFLRCRFSAVRSRTRTCSAAAGVRRDPP